MTERYQLHKVPSADPDVAKAVDELLDDPDAYFSERRTSRMREAHEEVEAAVVRHMASKHRRFTKRRAD
ncbi:hypothetical protein [Sciscionella sediminilitoris]|uniref:hypothetical protein n=1 Tax=Sciscionella sediminilitoris TaxID=1445613 RepID=UPI0012E103F2|nr:hypothetical protein [Sciscionella sp. SE31]